MFDFDNFIVKNPWSAYREEIKKVTISFGVTTIAEAAFAGYTSLESIKIPSTVTTIGDNAFQNASCDAILIPDSLTPFDIPGTVDEIDAHAFCGCT